MMPTPEKSVSNPEVIGIVGCVGDLGSRITLQALEAGYEVLGFDLNTVEPENVTKVDGLLSRIGKLRVQRTTSIQELTRSTDVVHWCAPLRTLRDYPLETKNGLLLLHDSVMSNSLRALPELQAKTYRSIGIVHFLMNQHAKVVVADESDCMRITVKHVLSLGLDPSVMTATEHDRNMAHSQAPFALLHELLSAELERLEDEGLLTPSGAALSQALRSRTANWTDETFDTLLTNPQLPYLIEDMAAMLRVKNGQH